MPTDNPRVLVVEDDLAIRRGLVDALKFSGFDVFETADGNEASRLASNQPIDLVLLDWVLPGASGIDVLCEIRTQKPTLPVIMLTARGVEEDRVRGLRAGADDYVVKPFSVKELMARVEAVLRRSPQRTDASDCLPLGEGVVDTNRLEFRVPQRDAVALSQRECDLLKYLWEHANRVISRDELLENVWRLDPKGLSTRTVDMHVVRIREKIELDPSHPGILMTVRGRGYKLVATKDGTAHSDDSADKTPFRSI